MVLFWFAVGLREGEYRVQVQRKLFDGLLRGTHGSVDGTCFYWGGNWVNPQLVLMLIISSFLSVSVSFSHPFYTHITHTHTHTHRLISHLWSPLLGSHCLSNLSLLKKILVGKAFILPPSSCCFCLCLQATTPSGHNMCIGLWYVI